MLSTHISHQIYAKLSFEATNNQKKIIEKLSEWLAEGDTNSIFLLNGYAGTGKTTIIASFVAAIRDLGIKPILLAPTGRAAKVLSHYSNYEAHTIHSSLPHSKVHSEECQGINEPSFKTKVHKIFIK
mgnify:CR=1 FL=1